MPRLDAVASRGKHFPGVYGALLAAEMDRNERDDRRRAAWPDSRCFRRSRLLAERLEAGEPVVVGRARVESALFDRSGVRERLPFHREVRSVEVSPDDVIGVSLCV